VSAHTINPLALSVEELYGSFEAATHEWRDGVLTRIMRTVCRWAARVGKLLRSAESETGNRRQPARPLNCTMASSATSCGLCDFAHGSERVASMGYRNLSDPR
jgi:hypothetical protein